MNDQNPSHRPPFLTIRLWPQHHLDKPATEEVLAALQRHPGCCDEVWLCTLMGFPAIETHRESAEKMAVAAERFRAAGILPSIQNACSLGHASRGAAGYDGVRWRSMVGPDGRTATGCACPRDAALHDYHRQIAALYAAFQPHAYWIDDDLRMVHHSRVSYPCFCAQCLADFAKATSAPADREKLAAAINADGDIRRAWTLFNGESLAQVARAVAEGVHSVAPHCLMGLQQCDIDNTLYHGPDWAALHEAMAEVTSLPTVARPGSGYYTEHQPRGMTNKALRIGRQIARAAPCVQQNCAEVESFPHVAMTKTPRAIAVESALYLATGCDSLSYAVLSSGMEEMPHYEAILARLAAWRPFLETYQQANRDAAPGGLSAVMGKDHILADSGIDTAPFPWARADLDEVYKLADLGMPLCCDSPGACGAFIAPNAADGLTREELQSALKIGAIADGEAVMRLLRRGMGNLLGVRLSPAPPDAIERLADDPLNGRHAGQTWRPLPGGPRTPYIIASDGPMRILGEYVRTDGHIAGAATALVQTPGNGRLAILGYHGLTAIINTARRRELLAAADWASGEKLPAIVETAVQMGVFPQVSATGELHSLMLLNETMDTTPPLEVVLRTERARWKWCSPEAPEQTIDAQPAAGQARAILPPMPPWSVACLLP